MSGEKSDPKSKRWAQSMVTEKNIKKKGRDLMKMEGAVWSVLLRIITWKQMSNL